MKYKINQELYSVHYDLYSDKCVLSKYKVRTIRGGYVYAVQFIPGLTWVKLSKKNGDYGWDKSIDSIFRKKTIINEQFEDLHATKKQAWKSLIKKVTENRRGLYSEEQVKKILKTAKRFI